MNHYTLGINNTPIKCSASDATLLINALKTQEDEVGIAADFEDGKLYIFGEERFLIEELKKDTLEFIGKLLKAEGKRYLQFDICYCADKLRPGSHGGSTCIVTDEGIVVYEVLQKTYVWTDLKNKRHSVLL